VLYKKYGTGVQIGFIELVKALFKEMAHLLYWFSIIELFHSQKMRKAQNRFSHNRVKNKISIWVFHIVCQFGFFTSISIRAFAPFPFFKDQ
jgi:hypothetical protein